VREFGFELALCAQLEDGDRIVSRQLGGSIHGRRILDTVLIEPTAAISERVEITAAEIPSAAIEADVGPGRARYWKDAFDCHPDRERSAIERAVDCGFFEKERRNGRTYIRQTARYPDWIGEIVGIENKPDLNRPGALETQLRTDVSLGLLDRVVLATADHVTRAHLNRLPDEVGVWQFDPDSGEREIVREATQLESDDGIELLERKSARAVVRPVTAEEKSRGRRRLAERAYAKGWRTFDYPACTQCDPDSDGMPRCSWKNRPVHESEECGPECDGYDPSDRPTVDTEQLREENTPWDPDPKGRQRRQSGLDRFRR
jgi:hypothetical protein